MKQRSGTSTHAPERERRAGVRSLLPLGRGVGSGFGFDAPFFAQVVRIHQMIKHWFCKVDQQEIGPYSGDEIRAMAAVGRLKQTDLVRKGSDARWYPASAIKNLIFGSSEMCSESKAAEVCAANSNLTFDSEVGSSESGAVYTAMPVSDELPEEHRDSMNRAEPGKMNVLLHRDIASEPFSALSELKRRVIASAVSISRKIAVASLSRKIVAGTSIFAIAVMIFMPWFSHRNSSADSADVDKVNFEVNANRVADLRIGGTSDRIGLPESSGYMQCGFKDYRFGATADEVAVIKQGDPHKNIDRQEPFIFDEYGGLVGIYRSYKDPSGDVLKELLALFGKPDNSDITTSSKAESGFHEYLPQPNAPRGYNWTRRRDSALWSYAFPQVLVFVNVVEKRSSDTMTKNEVYLAVYRREWMEEKVAEIADRQSLILQNIASQFSAVTSDLDQIADRPPFFAAKITRKLDSSGKLARIEIPGIEVNSNIYPWLSATNGPRIMSDNLLLELKFNPRAHPELSRLPILNAMFSDLLLAKVATAQMKTLLPPENGTVSVVNKPDTTFKPVQWRTTDNIEVTIEGSNITVTAKRSPHL